MSEFAGVPAGGKRPDGSLRDVGMPSDMPRLVKPEDVLRALYLTGDRTGYSPTDEGWAWAGLVKQRFLDLGIEVRSYAERLEELGARVAQIPGPAGPPGPPGPAGPPGAENLFVQTEDPGISGSGVWVETTLSGDVKTVWIETGLP